MSLKDKFSQMMAYFDTEDVETDEVEAIEPSETPAPTHENFQQNQPLAHQFDAPTTEPTPIKSIKAVNMANTNSVPPLAQHESFNASTASTFQQTGSGMTIDIKSPKKYEDARGIADLLKANTSVLIDFQHMTDSQARRCIDYLTGASDMFGGGLKRVSNNMFLLTPPNVVVHNEELNARSEGRQNSFDFDMKQR